MKCLPRRLSLACLLAASLLAPAPSRGRGQIQNAPPPESIPSEAGRLEALLGRVSERVRVYHERLFSLAFSETVRQERLRHDLTPGKPIKFRLRLARPAPERARARNKRCPSSRAS